MSKKNYGQYEEFSHEDHMKLYFKVEALQQLVVGLISVIEELNPNSGDQLDALVKEFEEEVEE